MSPRSCSRTPGPVSRIKAIKRHQREDSVKEIVEEVSSKRTGTESCGSSLPLQVRVKGLHSTPVLVGTCKWECFLWVMRDKAGEERGGRNQMYHLVKRTQ